MEPRFPSIDNRVTRMPRDVRLLIDRIDDLSGERDDVPPKPLLEEIEHTLTDGYAVALALEGESWRLQRRITELAARIESRDHTDEMRRLGYSLAEATSSLTRLRGSLAALRRRADAVRALAADAS